MGFKFSENQTASKKEISYPEKSLFLKRKSDPHVRVIGLPDAVRDASQRIRFDLQPHNKITMKLDVSWTCHSHIIGKGGNTIQPVVKKTGVSIHFPDGNKNSEIHKSNQVSINSRGEINGLEEARSAIRELTPLIFTFTLPATAQFISLMDTSLIVIQVQNTYNVQAELQLINEKTLFGSVKGTEWDATRVKEATLCLLQALCGTLANQMTVQMTIDISPQHHSFILGRNSEGIRRIMQRTATRIVFPDGNDPMVPPLNRSTVTISGAIENVYIARQNLIGSLPLVLMFDIPVDINLDQRELNQVMQTLDVFIIDRSKHIDGRRSVIIKGAERNATNIYEAWRLMTKDGKSVPKARIPPNYNVTEVAPVCGLGTCFMNPVICNSYSRLIDNCLPHLNNETSCCQDMYCNSMFGGECLYPSCMSASEVPSVDHSLLQEINNNVVKCDIPSIIENDITNFSTDCTNDTIIEEVEQLINLIPDRRAPGCEKKHGVMSDYVTKKLLATKMMKQPVFPKPRTPTSNWSGYGFSKSQPAFSFNELIKEEKHFGQKWSDWSKRNLEVNSTPTVPESSVYEGGDNLTYGLNKTFVPRGRHIDISTSNYMESLLPQSTYFKAAPPSDVNSILIYLQLEQYIDLFASQEVDFERFLNLNDQELKDLGVFVFGHRRKLLTTIKELTLKRDAIIKRI